MRKLLLAVILATITLGALAQIYPTPQKIEWGAGKVKFKEELIKTQIDTTLKADGYVLDITKRGVKITAADDRGAFYARQTLNQLLEKGMLPEVKITDFPAIRFRGVVEGFYGKPWSHRDRLAQFAFYGKNKLNAYIYGPKDDPYHSSLSDHADGTQKGSNGGWRVPYPTRQAAQITELIKAAKANYVDFVWAIHPGADIRWTDEDYANLLAKFNSMYELGVRSYAVFFDDIAGDGTNPERQAKLLNRINREFVRNKGDVTPLILCPTEYNKSWANPDPQNGYLAILGRQLDPDVHIMWTGDSVCADIATETLDWVSKRIKREAYVWWNFPVTDYVRYAMAQGPSYGLTKEAEGRMSGFVSNPMENAEASKIALFGVADYTWNPRSYDYMATWQEAIKRIMPQAPEAYRTFAIHSADMGKSGHNFRRDESWETDMVNMAKLEQDFRDLSLVNKTISESGADPFLVAELKPWLVQAQVVGEYGLATIEMLKLADKGDPLAVWLSYLGSQMSKKGQDEYNAHRVGTLKLMPWIVSKRDSVLRTLYSSLGGSLADVPNAKTRIYTNVARLANHGVTDVANVIDMASVFERFDVDPQSYFGVEFPSLVEVVKVESTISGGRLKLQYSADGLKWTSEVIPARFVRYVNQTEKSQNLRLDKFTIQIMPGKKNPAAMTDGDLRSAYELDPVMHVSVPVGAVAVTVMGEDGARANIEGVGVNIPLTFLQRDIPEGVERVTITNARGKIREIIWKIKK